MGTFLAKKLSVSAGASPFFLMGTFLWPQSITL